MFSTSMMASSTTTPMATTNPASTMTFKVTPAASSTRTAATSDSGMAIRLMKAVRHSNRNATMINVTSSTPSSSARVRFSRDCSMKVAGRKMVVSTSIPGSPGAISAMACSTPRVTSTVLAPRYFCTTSSSPGPSLTTASPISGPGSTRVWPRSFNRSILPSRSTTGTSPSCSGPVMGCTWRMLSRCPSASTKPPVPTTAPSEYCSRPLSRASADTSMTCWSEMSCSVSLSRVDLDVALRQPLTPDRHLGHAGHAQQPRPGPSSRRWSTCRRG